MKNTLITTKKSYGIQRGVTLIELLIAVSLILLILSLAYSIYLFGIQGYINNTTAIENQSNLRIAMEHITYHIRRTNNVSIRGDLLIVGDENYRLSKDVLMNKNNQLATGISEFSFSMPNPSLVYIKISSIPDSNEKTFSLEAYFYLMD
ncbi:MAG: prepilin-type N-terminal cleavage/methylation domain-containing protein [Clostridiales bacterium]|nr:prepilin-type N-terminal cleavage/methylation domain-containing protein [Clostridiales bacterium]